MGDWDFGIGLWFEWDGFVDESFILFWFSINWMLS